MSMALGVRIRTALATMVPECCEYDTMKGPGMRQREERGWKGGREVYLAGGRARYQRVEECSSRNFSVELPGERSE